MTIQPDLIEVLPLPLFPDPEHCNLVQTERLELSRLSPPPPQDGVSTNSTTSAYLLQQAPSGTDAQAAAPHHALAAPYRYFGTSPDLTPSAAGAPGAVAGVSGTDCPMGVVGTGTSDGVDLGTG
jgi:hypothetical protein